MHHYSKHIGDYYRKAGRLSILEHGAYNLLMDACYDRERFPTEDEAIEWCWARSEDEIDAVKFVLHRFFTRQPDGTFEQKAIKEKLQAYWDLCARNKQNGKKGGRPEKTQSVNIKTESEPKQGNTEPSRNPQETQTPEYETAAGLTINHKPITINQDREKPDGFPWKLIRENYNEILGNGLGKIRDISPERQRHLKARIREDPKRQDPDWWRDYFGIVAQCGHLMGNSPPRANGRPWKASFDWLINPNNMTKVLEGKYV